MPKLFNWRFSFSQEESEFDYIWSRSQIADKNRKIDIFYNFMLIFGTWVGYYDGFLDTLFSTTIVDGIRIISAAAFFLNSMYWIYTKISPNIFQKLINTRWTRERQGQLMESILSKMKTGIDNS